MKNRIIYDDEVTQFPTGGILGNATGAFCLALSEVLDIPREFLFTLGIMAVSAATNRGLFVETVGGQTTGSNLYSIQGLPSGTGKTQVYSEVCAPHVRFQVETQKAFRESQYAKISAELKLTEKEIENVLRGTDQVDEANVSRLTSLHQKKELLEHQQLIPRFLAEDATPEALEKLLAQHDAIDLISSDGRSIMKNLTGEGRRGNQTEEDIYIKGFSGDAAMTDRITRDSVCNLKGGRLSMCVAVQNDLLTKLYGNSTLSPSGIIGRILPLQFFPEEETSMKGASYDLQPFRESYHKQINELLSFYRVGSRGKLVVKASDEARNLLVSYAEEVNERSRTQDEIIAQCMARWAEIAWRIALILQAMNWGVKSHEQPLHVWFAGRAIKLVEWYGKQQSLCLENAVRKTRADQLQKLDALFTDAGKTEILSRDAQRAMRVCADGIEGLVRNSNGVFEFYQSLPGPSGGRPKKMIRKCVPAGLNPPV